MPVYAFGAVGGSFQVGDDIIPPDSIPPATVNSLSVVSVAPYSIKLKWIAPGNDGNIGTATRYDIRFSLSPITNEMQWADSNLVYTPPKPKASGSTEIVTVNGLLPLTTYYFALKTADKVFNWSGLSNCVKATTSVGYLEWEEDEEDEEDELPHDDIIPTPIPDLPPIHFDIKGKKGVIYLNLQPDGSLAQTWIITLNNRLLEMVLPKGTILLDNAGKPISVIVLKCVEPFGEAPAGFEFSAIYDFQPTCTIKPPISIKMGYNRENLNEGVNEADIYIAYYNQNQGNWVPLSGTEDIENQAVSTDINHFSFFCLLVPKFEITPLPSDETVSPHLKVTRLTLSSNIIEQGENLIISVNVVNESDTAGDFYLPLFVNGVTLDSKIISLAAKQEKSETFTIVLDEEGTHAIGVGSMLTSITVKKAGTSAFDISWLRLPMFWIAVVGLVVMLILAIINRRRKNSAYSRRL